MYRATHLGSIGDKLFYASPKTSIWITGARLIDGTGRDPIEDTTILIKGERITSIGIDDHITANDLANTLHIDARGKTVMPGLIDLHLHFTGDTSSDPYRRYIHPSEDERIIRACLDAYQVLSAGFTTVRVLGHGTPNQAESLKTAFKTQLLAGPRIFHAGWAISQTGGHGNLSIWPYELVERLRPRSMFADGVTGCRIAVRENLGQGADLIKFYATEGVISTPAHKQGIPNFTIAEISAMADEAHRRGATIAAHATAPRGILNAIDGGVDTIEHGASNNEMNWLERMAERGAVLVPTLTVFAHAASNQSGRFSPELVDRLKRNLEGSMKVVERAKRLGVRIGAGTDDGRSPLAGENARELELLVEAGLSPMEAIQSATKVAGEALGKGDDLGTLEPGKVADVLIIDGDPLQDIQVLRDKNRISRIIKSTAAVN